MRGGDEHCGRLAGVFLTIAFGLLTALAHAQPPADAATLEELRRAVATLPPGRI